MALRIPAILFLQECFLTKTVIAVPFEKMKSETMVFLRRTFFPICFFLLEILEKNLKNSKPFS